MVAVVEHWKLEAQTEMVKVEMEHQMQLQEQIQRMLVVEVVVQNQHQDHQELVETVVVEQEEMLPMVQLGLQTLGVAVEQGQKFQQ